VLLCEGVVGYLSEISELDSFLEKIIVNENYFKQVTLKQTTLLSHDGTIKINLMTCGYCISNCYMTKIDIYAENTAWE
jgi:hypothetical protein